MGWMNGLWVSETNLVDNAALRAIGSSSEAIDKSKKRRGLEKQKRDIEDSVNFSGCLGYDGRKDDTLVDVKIGGTNYRREVKEEHVSLVLMPGGYIGHMVLDSESARSITNSNYMLFSWQKYTGFY